MSLISTVEALSGGFSRGTLGSAPRQIAEALPIGPEVQSRIQKVMVADSLGKLTIKTESDTGISTAFGSTTIVR